MMLTRSPRRIASSLAVAALAASGCALHAQGTLPITYQATPAATPLLAQVQPFNLAKLARVRYVDDASSSSSSVDAVAAGRLDLPGDALQPPARRRRYGRPRYNDNMHNADGSNKLAIMVGGGLTAPVGDPTTKYLKLSYKFQGGVGVNFNKNVGVLLQFDYDKFGLPNLATQRAYYQSFGFVQRNPDGTISPVNFTNLDGSTHIWSFTLNPTFNFYQGDTYGAYAVVGGGFYHKVTNFTLPSSGTFYDPYYGYYSATYNQTFDSYVSNSAGVNGGIGFTYRPSRFASERIFAEARLVHTFDNNTGRTVAQSNFYPANKATSTYIPVSVGIRF